MSANNPPSKKNYLPSVIQQSTGLEREFFKALEKQENTAALLESLGIMQVEKNMPFGTVQEPGKKIEPLLVDEGETAAINFRRKLVWHEAFKQNLQARQLLIFDPSEKKWPGMQPITIVLVDDKLKILSWVESGGTPMFEKAALLTDRNPYLLQVSSVARNNAIVTEQFEIREKMIEKQTPQAGASREGDHCGDTHLRSDETDTIMKTTVLIQREKGDTNQPSPQWLAFQKHLKFGATAKPQILELLEKASPAGRLYAVILLKQLDPAAADRVLRKMLTDKTPVDYIVGCGVSKSTVAALAGRILKGEELVSLKH